MEDCRANTLGAIQVGLDLWRGSVLSSLLAGCEVWCDISPKTMKKLEHTNSLFLANLFGVSKRGCPEVSLYTESSTLLIPNQILMSQLLFLHHIATLPITSLARETYEEMKKHNFPGLVKNLEMYLRDWKLEEVESFSKWSWKKEVKKRITEKNWSDLIKWSERYKKVDTEQVKLKGKNQSIYMKMNLHDSRILFRKSCH